jgi:mitogen-activated protein kinase organizer 1
MLHAAARRRFHPSCPTMLTNISHQTNTRACCANEKKNHLHTHTANGRYCFTGGTDRTVRLFNPLRLDPAHPPTVTNNNQNSDDNPMPIAFLPHALPIQTYDSGFTHEITAMAVQSSGDNDGDLDDNINNSPTIILSASDKTLVVHDVVTGQCLRRITNAHEQHQQGAGRINAVAMSANSQAYLSASYDATVRIWDARSVQNSHRPMQILSEATDSVTAIHVQQQSSGGGGGGGTAIIRTASVDGIVRSYDLRKGLVYCDDVGSAITGMTQTRDNQCLAVNCLDGIIRLLDLSSSSSSSLSSSHDGTSSSESLLLNTFEGHHVAGQYALDCCVTADDATIVSGSEDGRAVLYDLVRGTHVQSLIGHVRPTCCIAPHPKIASVMVTASFDGNAIVWAHDADYMQWPD